MEKILASQIMESALAFGTEIGKLDALISRIESSTEKKEFVDALGRVIGTITHDIVLRIVRQYPDLDPDK